jgi:hypothetical protein
MTTWRTLGVIAALLLNTAIGGAQSHNLSESPKPGECFRIEIVTTLSGHMQVTRDDKLTTIPLSADNRHTFVEKVLAAENGAPRKTARHYSIAQSTSQVGAEKVVRTLGANRRLIVAQRSDALLCYSPAGPLTRAELDVTAEHFDTLQLTGILPDKEVSIGDTWKLSNTAAQALCLFEGLISQELTVSLKEVKDGAAIIAVEGKASGIDAGALVNVTVTASARYDLLKRRLISLEWKQHDKRDQGPASPASEVESVTTIKRELLEEAPKELTKAALVSVPQEDDPPGVLKQLLHRDAQGRYSFVYPREWHIVGQTDSHLVLRLLDRGDFVAQAAVAVWKKMEPGKHIDPEEFQKLTAAIPGWQAEEVIDAAEVPSDGGRWCYRMTARGMLDGAKVVQSFYVLAGAQGEHVFVTFTMKPANAAKIGTRDVALVQAIEFPQKK